MAPSLFSPDDKAAQFVAKGRRYYAQWTQAYERRNQGDLGKPKIHEVRMKALKSLDHPISVYAFVRVGNHPFTDSDEAPYENYVHAHGKVIICYWNFLAGDELRGRPERIWWSDIMAGSCDEMTERYKTSMKEVRAIWRVNIVNPETSGLIAWACRDQEALLKLTPPDPRFFALVGTVHGLGLGRMLSTYQQKFGRRQIVSVWVFPSHGKEGPALCWLLAEAPPPTARPQPAAVRKGIAEAETSAAKYQQDMTSSDPGMSLKGLPTTWGVAPCVAQAVAALDPEDGCQSVSRGV
ncbi:uncharacterized protein B0T15DRAFT_507686 [Chaetomium strumarium]|uniref:Uncharacterized protein n=1 Tax=Chaetomium strumarium TaxID=1170767 RepID=A0AAJ0H3D3_9PEZI|nr:hypothetical protein B0T15DRAFT_507686 [Chaetomium strumarium]